ncbi:MAG: hypothetical protein WKG03_03745 [Telluria sp.]
MKLTRFSRLLAAGITLFSLLFTQLAVAAYACQDLGTPAERQLVIDPDMPGCEGMQPDPLTPTLCAAHCDTVSQLADTPAAPAIPPFIQAALTVVLIMGDGRQPFHPLTDGFELIRTRSPPLSIRNCCFQL